MLSSIFFVLNIGQLYVFVHTVGEILIHIPFSKKNLVHEKSIESNCKKGRHVSLRRSSTAPPAPLAAPPTSSNLGGGESPIKTLTLTPLWGIAATTDVNLSTGATVTPSPPSTPPWLREGPKRRPEGGEWEPIKILLENLANVPISTRTLSMTRTLAGD
jgi:hypothetical protein